MTVDPNDRLTPAKFLEALFREFYLSNSLIEELKSQNLQEVMTLLEVENANPNTVLPELGVAPFHILAGLENEQFSVPVGLTVSI